MGRAIGYRFPGQRPGFCSVAPVVRPGSTRVTLWDGKTLAPHPLGAAGVVNWTNR
jgi:hypothetical protein